MSTWGPDAVERAEEALAADRANTLPQLVGDLAAFATFGGLAGWWTALAWLGVVQAVRVLTHLLPWLLERFRTSRLSRIRFGLAVRGLLYLSVAAIAPLAAWKMGSWGFVVAAQTITAMLMYSGYAARNSLFAYLCFATPLALHLAVLFGLGVAAHAPVLVLVCLGVTGLISVGLSVSLWRAASQAAMAEERARRSAEAATAAKSGFVAMVSHELRTPISGILAGAEEIRKTTGEPASRANAGLIADAGRMMRRLLDDLLDLSKLEAGAMAVEAIDFNLRDMLRDTVQFWAPEARKQGLRFRLAGARGLPRWVTGDPTRLRQILNNLFSNALKFTEGGAITLRMSAEPLADGRMGLVLEVADTGMGMTAEQLGRLFRPFDQLSASTARTHGGTGLGLSISRELAHLMEGDLTASSVAGRGATFRLTVVVAASAPPSALAEAGTPAGLRVLLADDHSVNRQAFTLILQPVCDEVVAVADGLEALEALASRSFDLVLMDLNMPQMGGLEATRRLRAEPGPNQATPVIALTASAMPSDIDTCLAAGMSHFVMKPVEARELFQAMNEALAAAPPRTVRSAA